MNYPTAHRRSQPVWPKLAASWGLPLADIPAAVHYLWVRVAAEDGVIQLVEEQIRAEGRRLVYVDIQQPDRRLTIDRPHPWRPVDEVRALRHMREVLGEPLAFGQ